MVKNKLHTLVTNNETITNVNYDETISLAKQSFLGFLINNRWRPVWKLHKPHNVLLTCNVFCAFLLPKINIKW